MNKMRALVLVEPKKVEVLEVPIPMPQPGEVLLRVGMVGFCGGDLNGYRGTFVLQEYPNVLGHEVGATIEAVTPGVPDTFKPGQRVTLDPYLNCGVCVSCRRGRPNACIDNRTMGVRRPGAMAPLITVPWQKLHSSSHLTLKALALVEPLTVGFHAAQRGRVTAGDTVAVIGCGIVGMGAVYSAARRGARVVAVDIDDRKLDLARQAGAEQGINTSKSDLHSALQDLTSGTGPDVIIEAVGNPTTFQAAVNEVAFTGRVVYIGYTKSPVEYETRLFVQKELDIMGSRNCLGDFPEVIAALEKGNFPIEGVVSRVVTLDEAGAALADWSEKPGNYTKILLDLIGEIA
jgi:threonine dehydrogenase-like Zn-dependent dehydrogenase